MLIHLRLNTHVLINQASFCEGKGLDHFSEGIKVLAQSGVELFAILASLVS